MPGQEPWQVLSMPKARPLAVANIDNRKKTQKAQKKAERLGLGKMPSPT